MSSKSAKTGLAIVGIGALAMTGFGLAGVGPMAGMFGAGTGVGMGTAGISAGTISGLGFGSSTAAGAVGGGSIFAGMTGFQAASLGMGALSLGSSALGMMSAGEDAKIMKAQIEAEARRAEIQALQDKAIAMQNFGRARGTLLSNTASSGSADAPRDAMAEIEKGEEYLKDELGNIAVNRSTNRTISGLQIAGVQSTKRSNVMQGAIGGGRSLLTTYRDYNDSRMV